MERNLKLESEVYVMLFIAINKRKRLRTVVVRAEAIDFKKLPIGELAPGKKKKLAGIRVAHQKRLFRAFDNLPETIELLHANAIMGNELRGMSAQIKRGEAVTETKTWVRQYLGKVRKNIRANIRYLTLFNKFAKKEKAYQSLIEYIDKHIAGLNQKLEEHKKLDKLL
ncbi:MAG: hypothetical protein QGI60_00105 [archaeon]|nr:hypothetical protein [archaeon]